MTALIIMAALWIALAASVGAYAYHKGYSFLAVFVAAVCLGFPLPLLAVALVRDKLQVAS